MGSVIHQNETSVTTAIMFHVLVDMPVGVGATSNAIKIARPMAIRSTLLLFISFGKEVFASTDLLTSYEWKV